jgi:excisionase family DNA binding protein
MGVISMLTTKQAAERAGVSTALVYAWCAERRLPHHRVGRQGTRGSIRIAEADLDAFLASLKQEATPAARPPTPSAKERSVTLKHLRLKPS